MATCTVRWRPSGGRGEFEYVPADTLLDRVIEVFIEPLNLTIPAEVIGVKAQGKPRLRKGDANNKQKLHLPQLVMAIARLPVPAREDTKHSVTFPLENRAYVMDAMDFDIISDDGMTSVLAPLRVSILHSDVVIDLQDRFDALAADRQNIGAISAKHPTLAKAIQAHGDEIMKAINSAAIRETADRVIAEQAKFFGKTNAGSAVVLEDALEKPETDIEEGLVGIEGRLLIRIHAYKERDKTFAAMAKKHHKAANGGKLTCEACKLDPIAKYGPNGERCIEAHHKIPIEELQPDSVTRVEDMAMVCASCHRIIHSQRPCMTIGEVAKLVSS